MTKEREIYERSAIIERKGDNENASYIASLSSEYPVKRWGVTVILEHSESAVNMERARNGLVLLGFPAYWQPAAVGAVIILAVIFDYWRKERSQ